MPRLSVQAVGAVVPALIVQAPGAVPVVAAGVSRLPVVPAEPEAQELSVAQDLLSGRGRPFPPRRV